MSSDTKVDTSTMKPVCIQVGRGVRAKFVMIGYAGRAVRGRIPCTLPDGTQTSDTTRGRLMFLALTAHAKELGQARPATPEEIERRYRK